MILVSLQSDCVKSSGVKYCFANTLLLASPRYLIEYSRPSQRVFTVSVFGCLGLQQTILISFKYLFQEMTSNATQPITSQLVAEPAPYVVIDYSTLPLSSFYKTCWVIAAGVTLALGFFFWWCLHSKQDRANN